MQGVQITENDDDFTIKVLIKPEELTTVTIGLYTRQRKTFVNNLAFEIRQKMIPIHCRRFPMTWMTCMLKELLDELELVYPMHHHRFEFTPSKGSFQIKMESLGENDVVLSPVSLLRNAPILDFEDLDETMSDESESLKQVFGMTRRQFVDMRNHIKSDMDTLGLRFLDLARAFSIPAIRVRKIISEAFVSPGVDYSDIKLFKNFHEWLERKREVSTMIS